MIKTYLLIFILSGSLAVCSLIFTYVKRKNSKALKIWLIVFSGAFIISISMAIVTVFFVAKRAIDETGKLKDSLPDGAAHGIAEAMADNREYLLDSIHANKTIELLQSYEPDSLKGKVPKAFYTYFGFRDSYRFPLPYPYSINCVDRIAKGYLCNERSAVDIMYSDEGVIQLPVKNIIRFNYDKNIFIAEILGDTGDSARYQAYIFSNGESIRFKSQSEMLIFARKIEYIGEDTMMTVEEYSGLF